MIRIAPSDDRTVGLKRCEGTLIRIYLCDIGAEVGGHPCRVAAKASVAPSDN